MTLVSETGTAAGHIDFIEKLYAFITANAASIGWSAIELITLSSQRQATIRMGSACYFSFSSKTTDTIGCRIYFRPHTSFSSGVAYGSQSGGPAVTSCVSAPIATSFGYYFYADSNYFVFCLSIPTGYYQAGIVGNLELFGSASFGCFARGTGSYSEGCASQQKYDYTTYNSWTYGNTTSGAINYMRPLVGPQPFFQEDIFMAGASVLGHSGSWFPLNYPGGSASAFTSFFAPDSYGGATLTSMNAATRPWVTTPCSITAPIVPDWVYIPHPTITGRFAPFGKIPGVYYVDKRNIAAEAIITVGEDSYRVFPAKTANVAHRGQHWGIAIKSPS